MLRKYNNVIEELVESEVERQLSNLPPVFSKYKAYIRLIDVATYALNRLPPLYASSRQGKDYQIEKAQKLQIETIVRQAIVAVLKDPIRQNEPLNTLEPTQIINQFKLAHALKDLEAFLKEHSLISDLEEVTSQNLVVIFQKVLQKNSKALQQALQELQDLLFDKNLINCSYNLDLDNLVITLKEVILQLEKAEKSQKYLILSQNSELEFYQNTQLEFEQDEEDIPTEPMNDFNRYKL